MERKNQITNQKNNQRKLKEELNEKNKEIKKENNLERKKNSKIIITPKVLWDESIMGKYKG
jgi:hypothetical protein